VSLVPLRFDVRDDIGLPNRPAAALALRDGDREELTRLTRSSSVRAGLAQRARIELLAADGVANTAIADKVGASRPTVIEWRNRYVAKGIDGLVDDPRSGRPSDHFKHGPLVEVVECAPRPAGGCFLDAITAGCSRRGRWLDQR